MCLIETRNKRVSAKLKDRVVYGKNQTTGRGVFVVLMKKLHRGTVIELTNLHIFLFYEFPFKSNWSGYVLSAVDEGGTDGALIISLI